MLWKRFFDFSHEQKKLRPTNFKVTIVKCQFRRGAGGVPSEKIPTGTNLRLDAKCNASVIALSKLLKGFITTEEGSSKKREEKK